MGKHAPRRGEGDLRWRMPLPGERRDEPWCDGAYRDAHGELTFGRDGGATFDGERATWSVEARRLRVVTPTRACEGALGPDGAYLRCSSLVGADVEAARVLGYEPSGSPG